VPEEFLDTAKVNRNQTAREKIINTDTGKDRVPLPQTHFSTRISTSTAMTGSSYSPE